MLHDQKVREKLNTANFLDIWYIVIFAFKLSIITVNIMNPFDAHRGYSFIFNE